MVAAVVYRGETMPPSSTYSGIARFSTRRMGRGGNCSHGDCSESGGSVVTGAGQIFIRSAHLTGHCDPVVV